MQVARKVAHTRRYRRSLRLVKTQRRKKPRYRFSFGTFLSTIILLALVIMFNLSQRALIAQETLQTEKLKAVFDKEEVISEKLLLQTKNLRSPQRVETIATRKLAMIEPTQVKYIYLPESITPSGNEASRKTVNRSSSSFPQSSSAKPSLLTLVLDKAGQQIRALASGGSSEQASSN